MPIYIYKAIDKQGRETSGSIEGDSPAQVATNLSSKGYHPTSIVESKKGSKKTETAREKKGLQTEIKIPFLSGRVKQRDITLFTRQMSILLDAGMPTVRSLNILKQQAKAGRFQDILASLAEEVEGGKSLSEAMAGYPKVFPPLYINMIKAGEASGSVGVVLARLADFSEKAQQLISKVKSALTYPLLVILVAIGILGFLITFVVPKFLSIFEDVGASLPAMTQLLVTVSTFARERWYVGLAVIVGLIILFKLLGKISFFRLNIDRLKLRLPIFGSLLRKIAIARFSRTLGTLISSAVPILQALSIVRDTVANEVIKRAIIKVYDSVKEGESIAKPLEVSGVFPLFVVNMIDVGEETGSLDNMLAKVADAYDDDIDTTVNTLTSLLEPLLIVGMGLIVGFIVIAMFMPLIGLMSALGGGGM